MIFIDCETDVPNTPNVTLSDAKYKQEYNLWIESYNKQQKDGQRHFVYCKLCVKYPTIVQMHVDNRKLPPMATTAGTRFSKGIVTNHFLSLYHTKCKEAELLASGNASTSQIKNQIDMHISEANAKRANHIGKLFLQVYVDAKKLTSSAFSWPARFIAAEAGNQFSFNAYSTTIPNDINIQYVTPADHLVLLKTIATTNLDQFKKKIESARASSIHIDGSVDRSQIDKIYIILKIVNQRGVIETLFIGIGQQKTRGAIGLFEATKSGMIENVGQSLYELIMKNVTSICTDGENKNTGDIHSLWTLFANECMQYRPDLPLIKLWCSAHRMELVWGDATKNVKEVRNTLDILSSIASHFNESAMRLEDLKKIATDHQLKLLKIPKVFGIRWTEWTHTTLLNLLKSWQAIVMYCEWEGSNATATGFGNFLTNLQNMKLITFLADLLNVYKRYHKHVQGDKLTIVSLAKYIESLKKSLHQLQTSDTIGGWAEQLKNAINIENENVTLKGIPMVTAALTRSVGRRDFADIRADVLKTLIDRIETRFSIDMDLIAVVEPFIRFEENADIRQIHNMFATDLSLADLSLEFAELVQLKLLDSESNLTDKIRQLTSPNNESKYDNVLTILCRIQACTPQSADTERSIKANNLFKTAFRNRLNLETENKYMYIYFNMPPLEEWDPRPAVVSWINEKNRRQHLDLIQKQTSRKRREFKGIFTEVESDDESDDEAIETDKSVTF